MAFGTVLMGLIILNIIAIILMVITYIGTAMLSLGIVFFRKNKRENKQTVIPAVFIIQGSIFLLPAAYVFVRVLVVYLTHS